MDLDTKKKNPIWSHPNDNGPICSLSNSVDTSDGDSENTLRKNSQKRYRPTLSWIECEHRTHETICAFVASLHLEKYSWLWVPDKDYKSLKDLSNFEILKE